MRVAACLAALALAATSARAQPVAAQPLAEDGAPAPADGVCPAPPADDPIDFGTPEAVRVETAQGAHVFQALIADTPEKQARGLMFRTALGADEGMLFDFGDDRPHGMWMRNTCVGLDMVFLFADGEVASIARNAQPFSRRTISSNGPVRGVLEIRNGRADEIGLAPGDRIVHPRFTASASEG